MFLRSLSRKKAVFLDETLFSRSVAKKKAVFLEGKVFSGSGGQEKGRFSGRQGGRQKRDTLYAPIKQHIEFQPISLADSYKPCNIDCLDESHHKIRGFHPELIGKCSCGLLGSTECGIEIIVYPYKVRQIRMDCKGVQCMNKCNYLRPTGNKSLIGCGKVESCDSLGQKNVTAVAEIG